MAYTSKNKLGYPENIMLDIKNKFGVDVDQATLDAAIKTLTEKQRDTLRLCYVEQLTYTQAAVILGITSGRATACIKSRIDKALKIVEKYARHSGTRSIYAVFLMDNPSDRWSTILCDALVRNGFKLIDDFSGMKYSELLKIRTVGVKQLETIINRCKEYNVSLVADV